MTQQQHQSSLMEEFFAGYSPPAECFDEFLRTNRESTPEWKTVEQELHSFTVEEFTRRSEQAGQLVQENGVTHNIHQSGEEHSRPWELDILPVVYSPQEWEKLSAGLAQRARLLNLIIRDLFGPQTLLTSGQLPPEAIFPHPGLLTPFHNLLPENEDHLHFYGAELARSPDGRWWVMADRTTSPRGAGYALENRIVTSRCLPQVVHHSRVQRLAPFFQSMQQKLVQLSPNFRESPSIVLLSPGPDHPYYFEDAYLARYLGYPLVEGSDLIVRDCQVWLKTLSGLVHVDVIFRRVPDPQLDILELGGNSAGGVSGLLQVIRKGNVRLMNAPGCTMTEAPIFMVFLPKLCKLLLGEELKLPSIATWWCHDPESWKFIEEHFQDLVIKPAFQQNGEQEILVDRLSQKERQELLEKIKQRPYEYLAQEKIARSSTPVFRNGSVTHGHIALRMYLMKSEGEYHSMPGGLIRVASSTGPLELTISAGEKSKDAWVLSGGPVPSVTLLPRTEQEIRLKRTGNELPSRVAENLFWLGRYLKRAESSARLLRETVKRLTSESDSETISELPSLLRILAHQGQIEVGFALTDFAGKLPTIETMLPKSVFDVTDSMSLKSTVRAISRLSTIVRDRLSIDLWRVINHFSNHFNAELSGQPIELPELYALLEQLIIDLVASSGFVSEGMIRGPAWRFFDLGRRVEASIQNIDLLRIGFAPCQENDTPMLQAILEIVDMTMTYRSRYMAQLRVEPVLDLLLVDDTNPQSLCSLLANIAEHVTHLPRKKTSGIRPPEEHEILTALYQVKLADVVPLCAFDGKDRTLLQTLLKDVQGHVSSFSRLINNKFFLHSGPSRQFSDDLT